jgi:hypothetical protein
MPFRKPIIEYAHLSRGNQDIDTSHVWEAYYRLIFNEILAATADIQYMKDGYLEGDDHKGWVFGVRFTVEF